MTFSDEGPLEIRSVRWASSKYMLTSERNSLLQGFDQLGIAIETRDSQWETKQQGTVDLESWLLPFVMPKANNASECFR